MTGQGNIQQRPAAAASTALPATKGFVSPSDLSRAIEATMRRYEEPSLVDIAKSSVSAQRLSRLLGL